MQKTDGGDGRNDLHLVAGHRRQRPVLGLERMLLRGVRGVQANLLELAAVGGNELHVEMLVKVSPVRAAVVRL